MSSLLHHKLILLTATLLFAVNAQVLGLSQIWATTIQDSHECSYTTGGPCPAQGCTNMLDPTLCNPTSELYNSYKLESTPFRHCQKDSPRCCITDENPDIVVCRTKKYYEDYDCVGWLTNCTTFTEHGECAATYHGSHPECNP